MPFSGGDPYLAVNHRSRMSCHKRSRTYFGHGKSRLRTIADVPQQSNPAMNAATSAQSSLPRCLCLGGLVTALLRVLSADHDCSFDVLLSFRPPLNQNETSRHALVATRFPAAMLA